ncbi:MAG: hypothetical protein ACYTGC_11695, partial [Planctomycetota bacterium]
MKSITTPLSGPPSDEPARRAVPPYRKAGRMLAPLLPAILTITAPAGAGSDCCIPHDTPGCDDLACQDAVCVQDPFCCDMAWDERCAILAQAICPGLCNPSHGADQCVDALPISGEGFFPFDTSFATTDGVPDAACDQSGSDQIENDVWFCWTAPCDGPIAVQTCGQTPVDTKIAVYQGCACPQGKVILDCNDDACDLQSLVVFEAIVGEQYLLRIGTFPGAPGGAGTLSIQCLFGDNDDCVNATPLVGKGIFPFDTTGASTDGPVLPPRPPFNGQQIDHDVWFCWLAHRGGPVILSTCGLTEIDTSIAVYRGCACPPTQP